MSMLRGLALNAHAKSLMHASDLRLEQRGDNVLVLTRRCGSSTHENFAVSSTLPAELTAIRLRPYARTHDVDKTTSLSS
jgi:hypothetical protein